MIPAYHGGDALGRSGRGGAGRGEGEAPVSCLGEEAGGVVLGWAGRLLLLAALMLVSDWK